MGRPSIALVGALCITALVLRGSLAWPASIPSTIEATDQLASWKPYRLPGRPVVNEPWINPTRTPLPRVPQAFGIEPAGLAERNLGPSSFAETSPYVLFHLVQQLRVQLEVASESSIQIVQPALVPAPVPLPPAVELLGLGVAALAAVTAPLRRRRTTVREVL